MILGKVLALKRLLTLGFQPDLEIHKFLVEPRLEQKFKLIIKSGIIDRVSLAKIACMWVERHIQNYDNASKSIASAFLSAKSAVYDLPSSQIEARIAAFKLELTRVKLLSKFHMSEKDKIYIHIAFRLIYIAGLLVELSGQAHSINNNEKLENQLAMAIIMLSKDLKDALFWCSYEEYCTSGGNGEFMRQIKDITTFLSHKGDKLP
jgi:hypothetical protein